MPQHYQTLQNIYEDHDLADCLIEQNQINIKKKKYYF